MHDLMLRSAYESYGCGGEPMYTCSQPVPNRSSSLAKQKRGKGRKKGTGLLDDNSTDVSNTKGRGGFYHPLDAHSSSTLLSDPNNSKDGGNGSDNDSDNSDEEEEAALAAAAAAEEEEELLAAQGGAVGGLTPLPPGVECLDYIFYSATNLKINATLSIPPLSELRGERPMEPINATDMLYSEPMFCGRYLFDKKLRDVAAKLAYSTNDNEDEAENDQGAAENKEIESSGPLLSRSKIDEAKRVLKALLTGSHNAENTSSLGGSNDSADNGGGYPAPSSANNNNKSSVAAAASKRATMRRNRPTSAGNDAGNAFWGGRWVPFPQANEQRRSYFLPNDAFCSSHMALYCQIRVDEEFLSTHWA